MGVVLLTLASMVALTLAAAGSAGTGALRASANGDSDGPAPFVMTVSKGATVVLDSSAGTSGNTGSAPVKNEFKASKRLGRSPLRTSPGAAGPTVRAAPIAAAGGNGRRDGDGNDDDDDGDGSRVVLQNDWEGLNHRDSRLAFNGNQFSAEPPDQGLCAGNGLVLETVNSALRVYNARTGAPLSRVAALNELYGLPPEIDRRTFTFGPFTFDISCHYDPATNRWFHLAVDLDQDPASGDLTGKNYLDLAVSNSGDPRGAWTTYRIPAINDGTEGTPDHDCAGGPCFGDFPHIGADANGIYITTNEFPLFADGFTGAQVYAISKQQLVSLPSNLRVLLYNTADAPVRPGEPGFTVWPALSPGTDFAREAGGTQYFVSSNAVFDDVKADSEELIVWALTNTRSLDAANPSVPLRKKIIRSQRYTVPANSAQKPGTIPLADCLNDRTLPTPFGPGCWQFFLFAPPADTQVLGTIDTGDSRILDVKYAANRLWATLGTGAVVNGSMRTGVGWFIIEPEAGDDEVEAKVDRQGILALAGASLAYPTVGVTRSGHGALAFTLVGENDFPSAAFASMGRRGVGAVHVGEAGKSPQDGFTEYPAIGGNRPRWGDYSAAAVDGNNIFLATEYIEQGACTLADYVNTGFTCFGKRTSLANWSTRIMRVRP